MLANGFGLLSAFVLLCAAECWFLPWHCLFCNHNAAEQQPKPPLPPPPSYLSCVQWYMHVSIMALRSQNTRQPMNNRLGAWAMLHLQCKWKFIYVHTSRWKVQKALEKCFPNAFSTFFLFISYTCAQKNSKMAADYVIFACANKLTTYFIKLSFCLNSFWTKSVKLFNKIFR